MEKEYCAICESEATHHIQDTLTPLCSTCKEVYELGKENQGKIVEN